MKIRVFTLPFDPVQGFDDARLFEFLEHHDAISYHQQFFEHEGSPFWAVMVAYRVASGVPFLGFRIWPTTIRMNRVRVRRFRRKIRRLDKKLREGGMDEAAASRSAASLIGWTMHGNTSSFRSLFFDRRGEDGEGTVQAPTG